MRYAFGIDRCTELKEMSLEPNTTEKLARFAVDLTYDDLPSPVRDHARNLLIDSVGCALAADFGDETPIYADFARAAGGTGEATVIGSRDGLSLLGATLLNGFQITAATVCDTYVPAHVHITPEVVPPALAIVERDRLDGRALLTAVAVGAEVAVRVAAGINYAVAGPRGWHMPGVVGPFGAAAAVGRLLGLSAPQMRNAFGLAGSQSAGTWASWGTPTVKFHQSRGAASGLMAATLSKSDFTASADILCHPDGGILAAYSDGGRPGAILDGLGQRFELSEIALRLWPGGTPLQPTLTAVFGLIEDKQPAFDRIERVRIEVSTDVHEAHARFVQPKGVFEALLSFQFAVATALRDRQFWLTSLDASTIDNVELRRFMRERMEFVARPELTREKSRVILRMTNGDTLSAEAGAAKGTSRNPATLADVMSKFRHCASGRLSKSGIDQLLDLLAGIESQTKLAPLFELLRSAGKRA
jgi:2-methylcitrate dehydratase PrpD